MKKGTGDSSDDRLPKFFRVYLPDDSGDDLEIPVSFNSCLPSSVPKNVTVRSINGNVWNLRLRKRRGDPEKFSMVDGWKSIVKDEDLKGGEFLAFEFDGSCLFDFCIYGQATCKKLGKSVKPTEVEEEDESDDVIVINSDDDDDDDEVDGDDEDVEDNDEDADDDVKANDEDVDINDDDDVDDGMEADDDDDDRRLLDDPDNPFFTVILNPKKRSQLLIPSHIMKDYNIHFTERITITDPLVAKFGTLERNIKFQDNGSVFIKKFGSVFRRNNVTTADKMICEVKKNSNNVAHILNVHIVRG